jgi:signal transduction histidine kinase
VQHLRRRHDELEARVRERTAELEAQKQRLEHAMEERKRLEEQLLQAQKMEAVGRLAAGIAHDFNNLLTAIAGNASLLLMCQPTETAEIADCAQQIVEASERAASLTRQLLMFSRKQVIQPARQDLNKVVAHMTRLLQRILGEDVSLISQCAPSLPAILADAGMIEQILLNLAVNSRDAMPKGGQLTIATGTAQLAAEPAGPNAGSSAGLHVCLTVTDTGSGIAPADLAHIFEPFFTTKEVGKGTGLGLATVYGIVKQHQGRIVVESQVGRGTTFLIYFPALADAPP